MEAWVLRATEGGGCKGDGDGGMMFLMIGRGVGNDDDREAKYTEYSR